MDRTLEIVLRARDEATATISKLSSNVKNNFGDAEDASKKFGIGLLGVSTAAAGFLGYGAKIAGDLEASRQGFITLLGSAKAADDTISMIKKDAAATPFELPGLISANQMLTAVTHNGGQSESLLMNVGKALAAMGKGQPELDRIIVNLQQIGAVGHASMLDIKQFAFAGIPIFDMLTQATGKSGDELNNLISSGGVTFDVLEKMFNNAGSAGGRFANAFTNQAGTFNQLVSNMKDSFGILVSDIVKDTGIFDIIKNAISGLVGFMTDHKQEIVTFIKEGLGFIKDNAPVIAGLILGGLVPAMIAFAASVGATTLALAPYLIAGVAIGLIAKVIIDHWGQIAPFLTNLWNTITSVFSNIFTTITTIVTAIWNFISPIITAIGAIFSTVFNAIWAVVSYVFQTIKVLFDFYIGSYIALIQVGLATIQAVWNKIWGALAPYIIPVWNIIKDTVGKAIEWLTSKFDSWHKAISNTVSAIVKLFQNLADGVMAALKMIKFPHLSLGEGTANILGKEIKYPKLDVSWYEQGGWVPNNGLAYLHAGEYVLSKDMLAGRQAIMAPVTNNNTPININAVINDPGDIDTLSQKLAFYLKTSGAL